MRSNHLFNIVKAMLVYTPKNDVRYYMNGISFRNTVDGMVLVSTDGHQMLIAEFKELEVYMSDKDEPFILQYTDAKILLEVLKGKKGWTQINIVRDNNRNEAVFDVEGTEYTFQGIDGRFPDYQRVVPSETRNCEIYHGIGMNAKYMGNIYKALQPFKLPFPVVKMQFGGAMDSMVWTANPIELEQGELKLKGILMPAKLGK